MESFFRSVVNHFAIGEHFAENLLDQRDVDSVWTLEENGANLKTVHTDKKSGVVSTIDRRMDGDVQNVTLSCKDVVCTNVWRRVTK